LVGCRALAMQLREAPGEIPPKFARALEPFGTGAYIEDCELYHEAGHNHFSKGD